MSKIVKFPIRVYVDTSVIGGVFDIEFMKDSKAFFTLVNKRYFKMVISPLVMDEILPAGEKISNFLNDYLALAEIVDVTRESLNLRQSYIKEGILSKDSAADALHVALATVNMVPVIVSWNFKHIVNYKKIPFYNAVNLANGYSSVGIYSPREVIEYEE